MRENLSEREVFGAQVPSQWFGHSCSFLLLALHCIYPSGYLAHKSKYCLSIWKRSLGPLKSNLTSPALARLVGAWTELPGPVCPDRSPFSCSSSRAQSAPSRHHSRSSVSHTGTEQRIRTGGRLALFFCMEPCMTSGAPERRAVASPGRASTELLLLSLQACLDQLAGVCTGLCERLDT